MGFKVKERRLFVKIRKRVEDGTEPTEFNLNSSEGNPSITIRTERSLSKGKLQISK